MTPGERLWQDSIDALRASRRIAIEGSLNEGTEAALAGSVVVAQELPGDEVRSWDLAAGAELAAPCPTVFGPVLEPPAFSAVSLATQACFAYEFGLLAWPATPCCAPPVRAGSVCAPPDLWSGFQAVSMIPVHVLVEGDGYSDSDPWDPSILDVELFGAAVAVLLDNFDIASWALCQVESWSPELSGSGLQSRIRSLFSEGSDGVFPLTVTYVGRPRAASTHATMWAFTEELPSGSGGVGFILPIDSTNPEWEAQKAEWRAGGASAFCAAVQVASLVLHEAVHIVGDGFESGVVPAANPPGNLPGSKHEARPPAGIVYPYAEGEEYNNYACWDECRMAATIFLWAMSQRFDCLSLAGACRCMPVATYFAYSTATSSQLRGGC